MTCPTDPLTLALVCTCSYTMFAPIPVEYDSSYPLDRIMADYLKANSPIAPALEGRIVNCNTTSDALCPAGQAAPPPPALVTSKPPPAQSPSVLPPASPPSTSFNLQILHINDNHGRFEMADKSFGPCTDAKACFGGFARQATAIKEAKAKAAAAGADTLVLHAGEHSSALLPIRTCVCALCWSISNALCLAATLCR